MEIGSGLIYAFPNNPTAFPESKFVCVEYHPHCSLSFRPIFLSDFLFCFILNSVKFQMVFAFHNLEQSIMSPTKRYALKQLSVLI